LLYSYRSKVHKLTQRVTPPAAAYSMPPAAGAQFTCFNGTKGHFLTLRVTPAAACLSSALAAACCQYLYFCTSNASKASTLSGACAHCTCRCGPASSTSSRLFDSSRLLDSTLLDSRLLDSRRLDRAATRLASLAQQSCNRTSSRLLDRCSVYLLYSYKSAHADAAYSTLAA
jgi:hypothetical protein